jgi:lysophospholipase L1-like esterase
VPAWAAIRVGAGYARLLLSWTSSGNVNYTGLTGVPADYVLETSPDSTNGSDGTWKTVASVFGNGVRTRAHSFSFSGDQWVRLRITRAPSGIDLDEIDVHDLSSGSSDTWFFMGDSITALAYDRTAGRQPSFAAQIQQSFPAQFPAMIDGGIYGETSTDGVSHIDAWLALNPDITYWAIGYGTNDSGKLVGTDVFAANLQLIISRIKNAGRIPILARIPKPTATGYATIPSYNQKIDELAAANGLRSGPDLYTWFSQNPGQIGSDGVHPTNAGCVSINRLWVDAVAGLYADVAPPPPPPPPPPAPDPVPAAPSQFRATAASPTEVDLTWWDMSNNESSFEIERKTGAAGTWAKVLTTGANVSAINDINLTPGTSYVYRMRAVNVSGASAYTAEVPVTTPSSPVPVNGPAAPTHFTTRSVAATEVGLTWWDMSNNETAFEIERRPAASSAWTRVLTIGQNISIATDTGLTAATSYVYRMRSVNGSGASAYTAELPVTTSATSVAAGPAAPIHLTIRSLAVGRISVTWWDMSSNETRFEVERKTGASGTWSRVGTVGANVSIYDDTSVTSGVLYVYRARSANAAGVSAYTNEISATAP